MDSLKKSFRRHGLNYKLLVRNHHLAIYGVSGTYTDKILHYEVVFIRTRKTRSVAGKNLPEAEAIPTDEQFGRSKPDRCFQKFAEAEAYFTNRTSNLMYHLKEKAEKVVIYDSKGVLREGVQN
jgi:hypothetical protein